jgi:hypothetical protein
MRFSTKVALAANAMEQPAAQGKSVSATGFSPGLSRHDRIRSYRLVKNAARGKRPMRLRFRADEFWMIFAPESR